MDEYNEYASIWNGDSPRPLDGEQPPIPYNLDSSFEHTVSRGNYWVHYYTPIINGDITGLLESLKPRQFTLFKYNKEFYGITDLKRVLESIGFTGMDEKLFQ